MHQYVHLNTLPIKSVLRAACRQYADKEGKISQQNYFSEICGTFNLPWTLLIYSFIHDFILTVPPFWGKNLMHLNDTLGKPDMDHQGELVLRPNYEYSEVVDGL